jgi:hypothetical protein
MWAVVCQSLVELNNAASVLGEASGDSTEKYREYIMSCAPYIINRPRSTQQHLVLTFRSSK